MVWGMMEDGNKLMLESEILQVQIKYSNLPKVKVFFVSLMIAMITARSADKVSIPILKSK
jgi:hypothetical protein